MAYVSTNTTTLKYATTCANQVETATITGNITVAGNISITVTGKNIIGSPLVVPVAVTTADTTGTLIATKVKTALGLKSEITNYYTIGGSGGTVTLTAIVPTENDSTLNIASATGTATGLTPSPTSVNTTLGGTFNKLVDIIGYPDMGSAPSKLDTTTLSESLAKTSIFGLQEAPDLSFECNYDETTLNTINELTASNYFLQLDFGTEDGRFNWQGQIKAFVNGGGVDEVRKMTIVLGTSTPISFGMN